MNQPTYNIQIVGGRWTVNGSTFRKFTIDEYGAFMEYIFSKHEED